jgi:hypothetical protein
MATYRIESRHAQRAEAAAHRGESLPWSSEGIGDATGWPTEEAAWAAIDSLRALGDEWADAEYRVVEEHDADAPLCAPYGEEAGVEYVDAYRLARRVLEGRDPSAGDWRAAGYPTATAAARALVGDGHGEAGRLAVEIVAAALDE